MGELLLELLSEEIPARMQDAGIGFLEGIIRQRLLAANIPAAEPIESYVTPRRMVIIATHRRTTAESADQIFAIADGRAVAADVTAFERPVRESRDA